MSSKANKEISAMETAHAALSALKPDEQTRVLTWLAQKLSVAPVVGTLGTALINPLGSTAAAGAGSKGKDGITPRSFMTQKKPANFQERIACLAYCLTHLKDTPTFKLHDLTKMNSDAVQPNLSNASVFVNNSLRTQYLASDGKGVLQLTARGEAVVEALPSREAVAQALAEHPIAGRKRKPGKKKPKKTKA